MLSRNWLAWLVGLSVAVGTPDVVPRRMLHRL